MPIRPHARRHGRRRLPLAALLVFGLSGLLVVAVASTLYVGVWSGQQNTVDLARDRAELIIALTNERVSQRLDPARGQIAFLAEAITRHEIDPFTDSRFLDMVAGMLAAQPHVSAVSFAAPDYRMVRVSRDRYGGIERMIDERPPASFRPVVDGARALYGPYWGDVVWGRVDDQPLINLRAPVRDRGEFVGVLFIILSAASLSNVLVDVAEDSHATSFILIDGDRVLAHPRLASGYPERSSDYPLPSLEQAGDPVLERLWDESDWVDRVRSERILGDRGHIARIDGETYVFVYRRTDAYGPRSWLIGTYLHEATLSTALDRIWRAVFAGVAILVVSVALAWWIGRRLTQQVGALATAARQVRRLDFASAPHLAPSRFRELDDAAAAFNAMLDGLRWFEAYVPRTLVHRLVRLGTVQGVQSVEREVSVMFTDISGFTGMSQAMTAPEVARFLNRHFELVDGCIDAEDGTVDKHLGDGVMAFWGAPERQDDHAVRAARAAIAIARALDADNRRRRERGEAAVLLRIGIHTGPATVGNVGGPSRLNYTIVGDTVNTADRLCDLARNVPHDGCDTVILVSGTIAARLTAPEFRVTRFGAQVLRGRNDGTEVCRLHVTPLATEMAS